ncbi:Z1 domain-containing protein [Micromonospora coxensis]|uniref:Z1 domain-containing protein n=1 Tax=Micromonospora coxensis TaxID=356852 RepID=A0A1C5JB56_9ACTN|nr:Z1 domain-containing protein [Micromonospora coxensis]SCG67790.1 Z1 domain-containing protein [Micromonospora coxensis]
MTALTHDEDDAMQQAIRLVLAFLPQDRQANPTELNDAVNMVCAMQQARGQALDRELLLKEIQARVAVWQDDSVGLKDDRNHIEWLAEAQLDRSWDFWDRYRRYLEDVRLMPPRVVRRLNQSTDRILRQLEDPQRPGSWRRNGLVVGQVQSGKTGNYIGLACKAADAGYKLIVILAGIHNSLRSQTQLRVDEGLLGFDTQYQQRYDENKSTARIGVGVMPGVKRLRIASLTNSAEGGDFRRHVASNLNLPIGDYPVVLVIKKHQSILEYVRKWVVEVEGEPTADGVTKIVRDIPLLVIDDEADNASIDTTKDDDADPTRINASIRHLLNSFDKAAYVGYTATPFANIYIRPDADHETFGLDLFPDSFIESLPAPSNYLGPERVFGLRAEDPDEDDVGALPIFRAIKDHEDWMPRRHKKDWAPPEDLPKSLREALDAFVLTCATRRARGQGRQHNSMLVHVTRFMNVQNLIRDQIEEYLGLMRDRLRDSMGREAGEVLTQLRELWDRDFAPTSAKFPSEEADPPSWQDVREELRPALLKIEVRAINGSSRDALEYYEHRRTGVSVVAVGGNKLSRGLTLEGLSVSYYLRASNTYDTLLQMGRWFGYRPGYEDLCRLYTTPDLRKAYAEITAADNELRRDFEEMAALGETPKNFGLRVRASSAGLAVTAANKMRRGVKVRLSYSGELPETTIFNLRPEVLRRNFDNLERFVRLLGDPTAPHTDGKSLVWRNITPAEIIDGFLDRYVSDRGSYRVRPAFIAEYIRRCAVFGELSRWTVRLVGAPGRQVEIGNHKIGLVKRRPPTVEGKERPIEGDRFIIKRVLNPADESSDLADEVRELALQATRAARRAWAERKNREYKEPDVPTGQSLRKFRPAQEPLLIIYPIEHPQQTANHDRLPVVGFAISFPFSEHPTETEYVVNDIWRQQEIDYYDDEDPDE